MLLFCFWNLLLIFCCCWHCHTTSHSTTPHPMNWARRWYTVVLLLYDLCSGLAIFDFKWEEWEQITSAKLMTIIHIAFTGDYVWSTNGFRGSSANHFQSLWWFMQRTFPIHFYELDKKCWKAEKIRQKRSSPKPYWPNFEQIIAGYFSFFPLTTMLRENEITNLRVWR